MFTKFDKSFNQTSVNPELRRDAIADCTRHRTLLFWCAATGTVCALAIFFVSTNNSNSSPWLGISAAMLWMVCGRVDANLRVLKMMDQFYRDRDEQTTI